MAPIIHESLNAFCLENHIALAGSGSGSLAGTSFGAKDVLDVAGAVTGNGHPDWLRTHAPAERSATAVERLLAAGADLFGKTLTDELAYSLTGENHHYGTPLNPSDATRVPGGSSSGSASAVAAGAVDFALGSDCGGSVRLPASYCGILGMRPTHGRIPTTGVVAFAPSFDCVGWFARDPDLFMRVGRVLLADETPTSPPRRLLLAEDGFARLDPPATEALQPAVARIEDRFGRAERMFLAEDDLSSWSETFRTIQAAEVWNSVGKWVEAQKPTFGRGILERLEIAREVDPQAVKQAKVHRRAIVSRMSELLTPGSMLVLPSVPRIAPKRGTAFEDVELEYRHRAMDLLCCAGLAGLPQISMPLTSLDGLPFGISIVGPRNSDIDLLDIARQLCAA
ncbi:MAG: amidase [Albidovulum sp.]